MGPVGVGVGKQLPTAPDSMGPDDGAPEPKTLGGVQSGGVAAAKTPKSKGKAGSGVETRLLALGDDFLSLLYKFSDACFLVAISTFFGLDIE